MDKSERIADHRAKMPARFRKAYDIAMGGQSLRAAVSSFCVECMGYEYSEVKKCVSPQCPLFPYRPLRGVSYSLPGLGNQQQEATKNEKG